MSIRPPPLDGTNRRKSAREQPWADPALYAFLRERLRPLSVKQKDDLATRWRQTLNETCAKERIDNLVRGTLPMTAREAANFLTVTNLEAEWTKRTQSSDFLITPVSGQFDYRAQGEGDIREMDIAAVARAGISMDNIAGQLMAIDTALFAHMGSETWMGVANDWRDIAVAYPDTWRIWVNERNEVLAYWMFVNPTPDIFRKGVCGEYPEAEITLPTLRPLEAGPVHIYGPGMYVRQNVGRSLKHCPSSNDLRQRSVFGSEALAHLV